MNKVLTIAGSDSGGGSGIQADLKTILSLGGYGMSVVTAVTAQNTLGIQGMVPIAPEFVALQLESTLGDIGADCVKTGMLVSAEVVSVVAEKIAKYQIEKVVVDPVLASEWGSVLLDLEGRKAVVKELFPVAYLLTPNIPEAEILTGKTITTVSDMKKAAKRLQKMGPKLFGKRWASERNTCGRASRRKPALRVLHPTRTVHVIPTGLGAPWPPP